MAAPAPLRSDSTAQGSGTSGRMTSGSSSATMKDLRAARQQRRRRALWIAGGIVVVVLILAKVFWPSASVTTLTAPVVQGPFDVVVVETGELQAQRSVSITAPVLASGGRSQLAIQYIAPEGTTVDSGALLVRFDPADEMKVLADKENELKLSQADLSKLLVQQRADREDAKVGLENAKLSYDLAKLSNDAMKFEAESKQHQSKLELQKAKLAYEQAKDNVTNKQAIGKTERGNLQLKIAQLQNALDAAKSDLGRLTVMAPSSGLVVYMTSWSTGKKVTKGDQLWGGQPVIQLPDLSHMQAVLQVNEVDISKVKVSQPVDITLDAFPDRKFHGTVLNVASIGNPKPNNPGVKVFEVLVDVAGADSILKPGMTVAARIIVSQIKNVLSIPIESVFDDNGKPVVYVKDGSSFDKRSVVLGARNDNFVVVTRGVAKGEQVAMTDPTKQTPSTPKGSGNDSTRPRI